MFQLALPDASNVTIATLGPTANKDDRVVGLISASPRLQRHAPPRIFRARRCDSPASVLRGHQQRIRSVAGAVRNIAIAVRTLGVTPGSSLCVVCLAFS